jgi:chromosome segregation ATPase
MKYFAIFVIVLLALTSAFSQSNTSNGGYGTAAATGDNSGQDAAESRETAPQSADLFASSRNAAASAENEWLRLHSELDYLLASAASCSEEGLSVITRVRGAALRSLSLKADYYKKYRDYHSADYKRFSQIAANRASLRQDIENTLSSAERQVADVQRRKMELQASARNSNRSADNAVKVLEQMQTDFNTRMENARQALKHWDDAQNYTSESRKLAAEAEEAVRRLQEVLESESFLWQSYYDAAEARFHLNCQTARRDSLRPFPNRRPE